MDQEHSQAIVYKKSRFVARLPVDYLYSPSHYWVGRQKDGSWRVGLTKFATRMLGEMVDCQFDVTPGSAVHQGQVLGWIEGFKAISDIFCAGDGVFLGPNPLLVEKITVVNEDPHAAGWLFSLEGRAGSDSLDVHGYCALLDKTIDLLLEKQEKS
jgi:glycine cleavage system H protein